MKKPPSSIIRIIALIFGFLILAILMVVVFLIKPEFSTFLPKLLSRSTPLLNTPRGTQQATLNLALAEAVLPPAATPLALNLSDEKGLQKQGAIILAMRDGNFTHLFAYHPQFLPLTRLTNSNWDDITPALDLQGTQLAYSSKQNGYWNIYIWNLKTNTRTQFSDTPEYDGNPTWSPDGQWLAYETLLNGNLDILVRSVVDPAQPPIRLTDSPAADYSPAWAPNGREIAFVSTRTGEAEIWLAKLNQVSDRFTNLSNSPGSTDTHPAWSPDGRFLQWSSNRDGLDTLVLWDSQNPDRAPIPLGPGSQAVWSPDGSAFFISHVDLNQTNTTIVQTSNAAPLYPLTVLPGSLQGMDWKAGPLSAEIKALNLPDSARQMAGALTQPKLNVLPQPPGGRFGMVQLLDVSAPYAYLHDSVDEAYNDLRHETALETGWDALQSLENAYVPLTSPPTPTNGGDWLYTGRAIALNPLTMNAGWMITVQESVNGQTCWRIYLKARYQDGSQGQPISAQPWNMNARYSGEPLVYEKGGALAEVPTGYWIDFTDLARRYGFERLAARANWRSFFPGTLFNVFVRRDGLDWNTAMAEVYPSEAIATPTRTQTHTPTITDAPPHYTLQPPTPAATISPTPTPHATWTTSP